MRVTWIPHGEPGHSCGPYCPGRHFGTGRTGAVPGSPPPAAAVSLPPPPPVNGPPPGAPAIIATEPAPPSPTQPKPGLLDVLRMAGTIAGQAKDLKGSVPSSHSPMRAWRYNPFHKSKTPPLDHSQLVKPGRTTTNPPSMAAPSGGAPSATRQIGPPLIYGPEGIFARPGPGYVWSDSRNNDWRRLDCGRLKVTRD